MEIFKGTEKGFTKYIGPRVRNLVQQITKKYRNEIGECEHCKSKDKLESAHKKGKERPVIIKNILRDCYVKSSMFSRKKELSVNLEEFENKFKGAHTPIEDVILILCKTCHRKYDNSNINKNLQIMPTIEAEEEPILRIGKFVEKTFNELVAKNLIDSNELENLQKLAYSNSTFHIQFPFLNTVRVKDAGGVDRYWKTPVIIHQKEFFICSQWYEVPGNNDRPYYKKWLTKINLQAASNNQPNRNIKKEYSLTPNVTKNNFIVSKALYGQGKIIEVNFIRGRNQNTTYVYDHDKLYEGCINELERRNTWNNIGNWTSSTNIPGFVPQSLYEII